MIVFLSPSNTLTREERLKFAKGLNQPVVVFLTPTLAAAEKPGVVSFDVQYFMPMYEVELCGHGTIAAAKVILDSAINLPGLGQESWSPTFPPREAHTVEFITGKGVVVSARKVVMPGEVGGEEYWFEIVLPAGKLEKLPTEEEERVLRIFARAVGKEPKVEYIGIGQPPFQRDLLIVLDESESIEKLKLDAKVLVSKARVQDPHFNGFTYIKMQKSTGFEKNIVSTDSTSGKFPEDYIVRVFCPAVGIEEDQTCGSANCTMGPYWAAKKGITELKVRQVSERGGKLRVGVDGQDIKLRGQVKVTGVGQLFL